MTVDRLRFPDMVAEVTCLDIGPALSAFVTLIGDDTAAITRGEIFIPEGDWKMSVGLVSTAQGLQFRGIGRPIIQWDGVAAETMFRFRDSVDALIDSVILLGKSGSVPAAFVFSDDVDSASSPGSQNEGMRIVGVRMGRRWTQDSGNSTGAVYGVYVGGPNGVNNDQFYILQTSIHDCSTAGAYLVNAQSVWGRLEDVFFDTCGIGLWAGSNTQATNLMFNRNTVCDLTIFRDTVHDIFGLNAENSARVIDQSQNASIRVNGGKVVLSNALITDTYWAQFAATKDVHFENWLVGANDTTGKKVRFNASSTQRGYITIKNCRLPSGDTRDGYELNVATATSGLTFDIEQGTFRAKGTLEGSVTFDPASLVAGAADMTAFAISANAGVSVGDGVLVSFSNPLQSIMLTGNCYSDDIVYARFNNETGSTIDLASGKLRWRKLSDRMIRTKASVTYDAPSLANGTGTTKTITVPCALGDILHWGYTLDHRTLIISAYVSAANTASIRLQNQNGSAVNLASAVLNAYVIREDAFDFMGSKVIGPISLVDGANKQFYVTVPGARRGDHALCSFSLDMQGIIHCVEISADNTATVLFQNETAETIDLPAGVLKVGAFISLG